MDESDEIRITLPAQASYARVARLALTGLASRFGWTYDDLVDLRILVGELFAVLATEDEGRLVFWGRLDGATVALEAARIPASPIGEVTDLTTQILEAVVDEVEMDRARGHIRITKLRRT